MKAKRIIAIALVVMMSLSVLASCAGGEEEFTKPVNGNGDDIDVQFPSEDYNGDEFTFWTFTSTVGSTTTEYYTGPWIDSDDIVGVATNDAVYMRNKACEQKYNVKINNIIKGEAYDQYNTAYNIGDFTFDVVYGWANRFSIGVPDGVFHDFNDLDEQGYIDLEASYWNPSVNESLSVADRKFIVTNDITMAPLSWTGCMFFNPQIIEDFRLDNPHDLVDANEWTLDKFLEMVQSVQADLDGVQGISREDCYGLVDLGTEMSLLYGANVSLIDDDYQLAIGTERVFDLITKIRGVLDDKQHVFNMEDITAGADVSGNQWAYTRGYFAQGHSLFLAGTPELTSEFRDMDTGYGVVPLPKYDNNQKDYTARIDSCAGAFLIPNFEKRIDGVASSYKRTGMIMEYLAYKSSEDTDDSVLNKYYETTIKGQRQTIEKNKEMLDIVKGSGIYEWGDVYWVGGSPEKSDDTISGVLSTMSASGRGLMSTYKRSAARLQKAIDDIYNSIDALD